MRFIFYSSISNDHINLPMNFQGEKYNFTTLIKVIKKEWKEGNISGR